MKTLVLIGCLLPLVACGQQRQRTKPVVRQHKSAEQIYIDKQEKIIEAHADILRKEGRMPVDFGESFIVLGQYGWHTAGGESSIGNTPPLSLLQAGAGGGAFGAYTFYQPAFEQAKRSWWIHGVMKAGSDLLVAVNRNAEFDNSLCLDMAKFNGTDPQKSCPPMNSPLGYSVSPMYKGPEGAHVVEVIDDRTLRLDKKSPGDVLQFDMAILPPDYVDMCSCTSTSTATEPRRLP